MCGATSQQEQLEGEQAAFYQNAVSESQTAFAESQALQQEMEGVFKPILQAGPNQYGFSKEETDVLNAQAVEGTAENYEQAAKAVNEKIAAEGGGSTPGVTGSQEQLQEEVATGAAQQESSEETQIKEAGYAQGYSEFQEATAATENIEESLNPTAFETAATGAGTAAANTANQIAEENNSWINAAIGAAGAIGGAAVSENPGGVFD